MGPSKVALQFPRVTTSSEMGFRFFMQSWHCIHTLETMSTSRIFFSVYPFLQDHPKLNRLQAEGTLWRR